MAEPIMPPMPEMQGANMQAGMPPEAKANLMRPSEEMTAVLMARLANMTEEELKMLDSAITPEVARVLMKLLPELGELIKAVQGMEMPQGQGMEMPQGENVGALSSMG
jgi:hypothetical protein